MKKRCYTGFTLLETLIMMGCLVVVVWLSFALWRKAKRADNPAVELQKIEAAAPAAPASPSPGQPATLPDNK